MRESEQYYSQIRKEQVGRESDLLSSLLQNSEELKSLTGFEILFKVTTQIEDTRSQLKQAEQLVQRLKKHLNQLESLHRALTKK